MSCPRAMLSVLPSLVPGLSGYSAEYQVVLLLDDTSLSYWCGISGKTL